MLSWIFAHFDWVVGFTTLLSVELMIRRKWYAWLAALGNQFVWLTYIIVASQYGLLPLNIILFVQNTRGLLAALRIERQLQDGHRSETHPVPDQVAPPASEGAHP